MINKYNKGIIFKLNENENQLYLILNNIKKDDDQYLLVMPVNDLNKLVIDYGKAFMMKVDNDDNLAIENDKDIIKYVIEETIKGETRNKGN